MSLGYERKTVKLNIIFASPLNKLRQILEGNLCLKS
jgi:hypothetical protein